MAPSYKLTYFNAKGLAESIRFLLAYGKIDFEDVRIEREDWPKIKPTMEFGSLPVLEIDGVQYNQSIAICRFLAAKLNLAGNDPLENLKMDSVIDTIGDLRIKRSKVHYEPDQERKEKLEKEFNEEIAPLYLGRFEKIAKENKGHFALGRLTWIDLAIVSIIDMLCPPEKLAEQYPSISQVRSNVLSLPAIKEWVEKRPVTQF